MILVICLEPIIDDAEREDDGHKDGGNEDAALAGFPGSLKAGIEPEGLGKEAHDQAPLGIFQGGEGVAPDGEDRNRVLADDIELGFGCHGVAEWICSILARARRREKGERTRALRAIKVKSTDHPMIWRWIAVDK